MAELLIVIVLIVVTTAILFPLFATAPHHSRHNSCANNLKQLGLATLMYAEDNDDRIYPYRYNVSSKLGDSVTWEYYTDNRADHPNDYSRGLLIPYTKNPQVFLCPNATSFAGTAGPNSGSYGVNSTLFGTYIHGLNSSGVALSAAEDHAQTILLADTASVVQGELHGNDVLDPPSHRNVVHWPAHWHGACWLAGRARETHETGLRQDNHGSVF